MIIIEKRLKIQETKKWKKGRRTERHREEEKERIRKVFSGNQTSEIIPAKYKGGTAAHRYLRVAAYCRVSTYGDAQAGSFELQIQHFKEQITKNQDWQFVNIYLDEGVSGTFIKLPPFIR
ncbi:recombinase family protein [Megasphaera paucivorans]|uniref:Resolvase, N terminal domain n=1 Tax=Megasphaera paucivorans TaxID=349095 RepID=A0A1G9Y4Q2_9FIRM|nr:recombinase family protein [Megasphaera paucivorans]SDN04059.1 Resolvase, N terminal domain [Megasphaera paucivorans]